MSNPTRILIVDDDANLRKTLSDILNFKGFAPIAIETGNEALKRVGQEEIIVALIDLRLADMSGLEVLRGIKEISPQTECILLTGHASQTTAIEAVNLGAYSYYQKPYDIDQLLLSIRNAVEKHQGKQALIESQARYTTFINATTDMAFLKDDHFRYLIANEAAASFFRKPVAEIIGKDDFELLPTYVAQAIRRGDEQVLQTKKLEVAVEKMGGRIFEIRMFPVDLQDGRLGVGGYLRDITENRLAEAALRESQRQLSTLMGNLPGMAYRCQNDPNWTMEFVSEGCYPLTGYQPQDLLANDSVAYTNIIHPEDRHTVWNVIEDRLEKKQPFQLSYRIMTANGEEKWVWEQGQGVYDPNENLLAIEGFVTDITERKQAEEALRASEERFRVIFENANDAIHIDNAEDEIMAVNSRMCELMGYSREELLHMHVTDLQAPEIKQTGYAINKELSLHENKVFEGINLHRSGRRISVEISVAKIELPSGDLFASIVRDITERKQAEDALRKSEESFRNVFENATIGLYRTTPEGRVMLANQALMRMLGYETFEDLAQRNLEKDGFEPDYQRREFRQRLESEGSINDLESTWKKKDGAFVIVRESAKVFRGEDGNVLYYEGTVEDITERKRAEDDLRQRENLLNKIFEVLPVGLWLADKNGQLVRSNQAGREIWGAEPLIGQQQYDIFKARRLSSNREIAADDWALVHTIKDGVTVLNEMLEIDTFDGHKKVILNSTAPVFNEAGEVDGAVIVNLDITARRQAEDELRASEQRYQSLIEISPVGIFRSDAEGLTTFVSPYWSKISGLTGEKALGYGWLEAVDPAEHENLLKGWVEVIRERKVANSEYRFLRPDGSWVWVIGQAVPQFDTKGEFIGHIGTITDITARKLAEELTRRRVADLEVLYENSLTINRVLNLGEIAQTMVETLSQKLEWHHAVVRLYHPETNRVELLALHQPHSTPDAIASEIERLEKTFNTSGMGLSGWVIQHGEAVLSADVNTDPRYIQTYPDIHSGIYVPIKLGETTSGCISVESTLPAAFNEQDLRLLNTMAGQVAVAFHQAQLYEQVQQYAAELEKRVEDRTFDLQRANLELARAARMKDEFLASMSHELRTPLTGILGLSESLQLNTYGELSDKQLKVLKNIEDSGRHLLELINDILDLSKIEAGKFDLQVEPCSLVGVCQASLQMTRGMAQHKHQNTNFSTTPDSIVVRADARRLKQMLVNLLSNAVKFTPDGGSLGVEVQGNQVEQQVRITVWDTGIGINPEDLPRLFQSFVQLDSRLSRQFAGTGLGLSLVKRMAVLHGGSVEVESTPGKGSRFTIVLPWETEVPQPHVSIKKITSRLHRALTIEENEINAEQLTRYLKNLGISNQVRATALGAVEEAAKFDPSVILVHLNLPDKSGLELLAELKMDERTRNIPVIITSVEERHKEAVALGAAGYLVKPFSQADLQAELQQIAAQASKLRPNVKAVPLVLLADDNETILNVITDFLHTHGFQVIAAHSGGELLERIEETCPDVLLIDIQMPGMDGLEVMRRIRSHPDARISALPMIAVTALAMPGDRERCMAAGANEYLSKPLQLEKLEETIQEFCNE